MSEYTRFREVTRLLTNGVTTGEEITCYDTKRQVRRELELWP